MVGAHVAPGNPLKEAEAIGADCVQIFLSDPQGWKKPPPRNDADELRDSPRAALRPRPLPDQRLLAAQQRPLRVTQDPPADLRGRSRGRRRGRDRPRRPCRGRHPRGRRPMGPDAGDARLRGPPATSRTRPAARTPSPAASSASPASGTRSRGSKAAVELGFCFDTCHAHAAGEELADAVERALRDLAADRPPARQRLARPRRHRRRPPRQPRRGRDRRRRPPRHDRGGRRRRRGRDARRRAATCEPTSSSSERR